MKGRDYPSTAVKNFSSNGETAAEGYTRRAASVLSAPMLYLLDMGGEILWWMKTLWTEMRSLTHRIRILHKSKSRKDPRMVSCGLLFDRVSTGHLVLSHSTVARVEDAIAMCSKYPWVSDADMILALDGWDLGSKYVRGISGQKHES
jgi:hypothetical protein